MNNVYRKTSQGDWAVMGPTSEIQAGRTVKVHKKSGEIKTETIVSVGKPFLAEGVECVYGYTTAPESKTAARGYCQHCGDPCNPRYKTCLECSHGGQSFYDSRGNFVLGTDD